ncbi:hypothetical protein [Acidocella sp.]|uniref:hypothetical protein n=1 Tax=Acidocella sp. TaxID=50710 RepID=UPI00261E2443|nr:hypothetical protein [Acidocella sp.]
MRRLHVAWLPDGKRLHLKNGPVNVIIQAFGRPSEIGRAYDAGIERARALVIELADDVPLLQAGLTPYGPAARRAVAACAAVPGALAPVTALRGAMADEMLAAMAQAGALDRAFANNLGAVAVHLAEGQTITPSAFDWPDYPRYASKVPITSTARTRGVAAAGWCFDAYALGCVDRIHIAAPSSAMAEAALGAIAAPMVPADGAETVPATTLVPESLLDGLGVYPPRTMSQEEAAETMAQGGAVAGALFAAGIVTLALLRVGEEHFLAAPPPFSLRAQPSLEI